jgi:hypothetical protein
MASAEPEIGSGQQSLIDPVLSDREEEDIAAALAAMFPEFTAAEIRRRVVAHNRNPEVRCRLYISPLVQGELMEWRVQVRSDR